MEISAIFLAFPPSFVVSRFPYINLCYLYNENIINQKHFKGRMLIIGLFTAKTMMGNLLAYLLRRKGEGAEFRNPKIWGLVVMDHGIVSGRHI